MTTADAIDAFRRLKSNDARAAALRSIVEELSPYEWRQMSDALSKRTFHHDIVASLPAELVIQVFAYLDVACPFRLQSVSKHWHSILTSVEILRPVLNAWHSAHDDSCEGENSLGEDEYGRWQLRAERLHRYRTGHVAWFDSFDATEIDSARHHFRMVDHTISWVDTSSRSCVVKVFNLKSGKRFAVSGDGRESILTILTDQMVCFANFNGTQYACDLATGEKRSFRVPPHLTHHMSYRGRYIAGAGLVNDDTHIFVWDFDSRKCRTFQVHLKGDDELTCQKLISAEDDYGFKVTSLPVILIQPSSQSVVLCTSAVTPGVDNERGSTVLHLCRYSFSGHKLDQTSMHCSGLTIRPTKFDAIDRDGFFALSCGCAFGRGSKVEISILFDEQTNKIVPIEVGKKPAKSSMKWSPLPWKEVYYEVLNDRVICSGTRTNPHSTKLPFERTKTMRDGSMPSYDFNFGTDDLFFNDKQIVYIHPKKTYVGTFDKDVRLHATDFKSFLLGQ